MAIDPMQSRNASSYILSAGNSNPVKLTGCHYINIVIKHSHSTDQCSHANSSEMELLDHFWSFEKGGPL